jgi:signal transduction histidine kinase
MTRVLSGALRHRRPNGALPDAAHEVSQARQLAQHLQAAREDERARLARELHDELGALLTSAKLDAARLKSRLAGAPPDTLDRVISLKRRITEDLRPSALIHLGLVAALEIAAREFTQCSGIVVHAELSPVRLGPSAELAVYRLVQEALTNVAKHAGARTVWLRLGERGDRVEAEVRDDGQGFDAHGVSSRTYGLLGMRFRAEAEGGALTLQTAPGQGTRVGIGLPRAA